MDLRPDQRRRLTALAGAALLAAVIGAVVGAGASDHPDGDASGRSAAARQAQRPQKPPQLPRGGRHLFPQQRIVAFYGSPRDPKLGTLGDGTPEQAGRRLLHQARAYARRTRPVLPAMELIATVATAAPGPTGLYRDRLSDAAIDRYLRAARRVRALLILDVQPGRGEFGPEIERLEHWLREPDVGLALDPEWHVGPSGLPGQQIGSTDAEVVNAAAAYLSGIVREGRLPEKLLLVHRFTNDMIHREERLGTAPGVRTVVNVDGFGSPAVKIAKYEDFARRNANLDSGFKVFYRQDAPVLSPKAVLALHPPPDVIDYQ